MSDVSTSQAAMTIPVDGRASPEPTEAISEVERLLRRMRSGDREAAAAFMKRYGARVRRRIRGKLSPTMRRLFDSEEVLSTVGRRLDLYVQAGRLEADSQEQLWSLLFRMANRAVIDKARVFRHLEQVEGADAPFARDFLDRLREVEDSRRLDAEYEIESALASLSDEEDTELLTLWLNGVPLNMIALEMGITPALTRKRWERIKAQLRVRLEQ